MRILVAEDYEGTRQVYEVMLTLHKHSVITAMNGAVAFEAWCNAADAGKPFEVVILDVEMPLMNGLECAQRIREDEKARGCKPVKIVFLSGHLGDVTKADIDRLQIAAVETKPIAHRALGRLVETLN